MSPTDQPAPDEARILRVLDHIHNHPAEDLSLDALADIAAMSRLSWHPVFRAVTGEAPADAVRRIRMGRANADGGWPGRPFDRTVFAVKIRSRTLQ